MKNMIICIAIICLLSGCAHNTGSFLVGTRTNFGIDPQNATANISHIDGLHVLDVSRENSTWEIEIDSENGVAIDNETNTIKGIKRVRREVGPQITGYLVDLAEKDPESARLYLQGVNSYWLSVLQAKENQENK